MLSSGGLRPDGQGNRGAGAGNLLVVDGSLAGVIDLLSVRLIQLAYYRHSNPPLAANARHVIAQVLGQERG